MKKNKSQLLEQIANKQEDVELVKKILEGLNTSEKSRLETMIRQYGTSRFFEGSKITFVKPEPEEGAK